MKCLPVGRILISPGWTVSCFTTSPGSGAASFGRPADHEFVMRFTISSFRGRSNPDCVCPYWLVFWRGSGRLIIACGGSCLSFLGVGSDQSGRLAAVSPDGPERSVPEYRLVTRFTISCFRGRPKAGLPIHVGLLLRVALGGYLMPVVVDIGSSLGLVPGALSSPVVVHVVLLLRAAQGELLRACPSMFVSFGGRFGPIE